MPATADPKAAMDEAMTRFMQMPDIDGKPDAPAQAKPEAPPSDSKTTDNPPPAPPDKAVDKTPDKPADKPADKSDLPDDPAKWPRTAQEWKKHIEGKKAILDEKRAAEAKAAKLEADLVELQKKMTTTAGGPSKEDFDKLKAAHDEYQATVRGLNLAEDPEFKRQYDGAVTSAINRGKALAGERGDEVAKLLAMPQSEWRDERLDAIMSELSPVKQAQIGNELSRIDRIREQRDVAIQEARNNYTKFNEERNRLDALRAQQFLTGLVGSLKQQDDLKPFLQDADYDALMKEAMHAPANDNETAERIHTMARGKAFTALIKASLADKEQIAQLTKEIEELKAAAPKAGAGAPSAASDDEQAPKGATPEQVSAWVGRRWTRALGQ